jgi:hypothetical protein
MELPSEKLELVSDCDTHILIVHSSIDERDAPKDSIHSLNILSMISDSFGPPGLRTCCLRLVARKFALPMIVRRSNDCPTLNPCIALPIFLSFYLDLSIGTPERVHRSTPFQVDNWDLNGTRQREVSPTDMSDHMWISLTPFAPPRIDQTDHSWGAVLLNGRHRAGRKGFFD